ncbi:hypothetical protein ACF07W_11265 [Streptomyces sp. NPDC015140]|uniref:hypothetical protein n=1 Tax=Streptomyces sp. NPDC015140 TaxID=3364943 RepID=UPI0036F8FFF5
MTPWLRTLRATGLVGALGFGALVSPYGVGAAHGVAGFAAVGGAFTPSPSGPGHGAVPGAAADRPDGGGDQDGRGGHERPGQSSGHEHPGRPERPERPEAGPAAPSAGQTRPGGGRAHGSATPSITASPSKSGASARSAAPAVSTPEPSRAGSVPGEGRQRPGRAGEWRPGRDRAHENADRRARGDHDGPAEDPATAQPPGEAALVPSAAPSQSQPGTGTRAAATEPVLRVLPLGSGLVLIGLGLALAFVGLRLRRG